mmetsp:Transcript_20821/g.67424  ORF Transcript_20821/g.67424 Transcript_20821/m.67424 type:complete len:600 (-) Transcript_20821:368-2167(-)
MLADEGGGDRIARAHIAGVHPFRVQRARDGWPASLVARNGVEELLDLNADTLCVNLRREQHLRHELGGVAVLGRFGAHADEDRLRERPSVEEGTPRAEPRLEPEGGLGEARHDVRVRNERFAAAHRELTEQAQPERQQKALRLHEPFGAQHHGRLHKVGVDVVKLSLERELGKRCELTATATAASHGGAPHRLDLMRAHTVELWNGKIVEDCWREGAIVLFVRRRHRRRRRLEPLFPEPLALRRNASLLSIRVRFAFGFAWHSFDADARAREEIGENLAPEPGVGLRQQCVKPRLELHRFVHELARLVIEVVVYDGVDEHFLRAVLELCKKLGFLLPQRLRHARHVHRGFAARELAEHLEALGLHLTNLGGRDAVEGDGGELRVVRLDVRHDPLCERVGALDERHREVGDGGAREVVQEAIESGGRHKVAVARREPRHPHEPRLLVLRRKLDALVRRLREPGGGGGPRALLRRERPLGRHRRVRARERRPQRARLDVRHDHEAATVRAIALRMVGAHLGVRTRLPQLFHAAARLTLVPAVREGKLVQLVARHAVARVLTPLHLAVYHACVLAFAIDTIDLRHVASLCQRRVQNVVHVER